MNKPSETSLHREQTGRTHNAASIPDIEQNGKTLVSTSDGLITLAIAMQRHLDAAASTAVAMQALLEQEGVQDIIDRRLVPGVTVKSFAKDIRPWCAEYITYKLGGAAHSTLKVFQVGVPLSDVIKQDNAIIGKELANLKARAIRGW
jgi:hypothetical protein